MEIQLFLVMAMLLIGTASAGQMNETPGHHKVIFSVPVDLVLNKMVKHTETMRALNILGMI